MRFPIQISSKWLNTRTSPAGAWGAEGFNAEGITLGNQSRSFLPIACFCGYFRCFELVSIISLGISRFSIVFSVFSHGFLWVPMHRSQPISFLYPNPPVSVEFPAVFHGFRPFFWVFSGISSCFGCYPVCSRCFLWVSNVFRSLLLPPIAQSARCACQKPKDIANPFTNTPRFGLLTRAIRPYATPLFSTGFQSAGI